MLQYPTPAPAPEGGMVLPVGFLVPWCGLPTCYLEDLGGWPQVLRARCSGCTVWNSSNSSCLKISWTKTQLCSSGLYPSQSTRYWRHLHLHLESRSLLTLYHRCYRPGEIRHFFVQQSPNHQPKKMQMGLIFSRRKRRDVTYAGLHSSVTAPTPVPL